MPLPALIAFDLDDTLAASKSPLENSMVARISELLERTQVCIISGGNYAQFEMQVVDPLMHDRALDRDRLERLHLMPTCGTQYYRFDEDGWTRRYAEILSVDEVRRAKASLQRRARELGLWETETWGPVIEDRESQVTFSALGQVAPVAAKAAWDSDGTRKSLLRDSVAADLPDLEVRSGGSTSVDVTRLGIDKAYGMRKLQDATGIALEQMLFIGDRLDADGNDFPVIATGVMTLAVTGWEHTLTVVDELLAAANTVA